MGKVKNTEELQPGLKLTKDQETVKEWLTREVDANYGDYVLNFVENGYNSLDDITKIDQSKLPQIIGDMVDALTINAAISKLKFESLLPEQVAIQAWLVRKVDRKYGGYVLNFVDKGYDTIDKVMGIDQSELLGIIGQMEPAIIIGAAINMSKLKGNPEDSVAQAIEHGKKLLETKGNQDIKLENNHQKIRDWLEGLGLSEYENNFIDNGYGSLDFIAEIVEESELTEINITNPGHITTLLNAINALSPKIEAVDEDVEDSVIPEDETPKITLAPRDEQNRQKIRDWLEGLGLSDYENNFIDNDYDSLDFIAAIVEESELTEINITNPGHITTLLNAINKLSPEIRKINDWLEGIHADYASHLTKFIKNGYNTLDKILKIDNLTEVEVIVGNDDGTHIYSEINNENINAIKDWLRNIDSSYESYSNEFVKKGYDRLDKILKIDTATEVETIVGEDNGIHIYSEISNTYIREIKDWLRSIDSSYEHYWEEFIKNGYDRLDKILKIDAAIINVIKDPVAAMVVYSDIDYLNISKIKDWLRSIDVSYVHYSDEFIENGYNHPDKILKMPKAVIKTIVKKPVDVITIHSEIYKLERYL